MKLAGAASVAPRGQGRRSRRDMARQGVARFGEVWYGGQGAAGHGPDWSGLAVVLCSGLLRQV